MEKLIPGAAYTVRVIEVDAHGYSQLFDGDHAFSDAIDYLGTMKLDSEAQELWLTRLDGVEWVFVERLKRTPVGDWERCEAKGVR